MFEIEMLAIESLSESFPGIEDHIREFTHDADGRARINRVEFMRAIMALDSAQRAREGQEPGV
jgi:hypothetical protein